MDRLSPAAVVKAIASPISSRALLGAKCRAGNQWAGQSQGESDAIKRLQVTSKSHEDFPLSLYLTGFMLQNSVDKSGEQAVVSRVG